ncbi:MAG: hypothetical protein ACD_3C00020G0002 [uncultured bacterium (gcode 4)]|uniref:Peptidase S74 domain-containing protein n=1 Tax=uncultured bacterium (gcode 4) TaxID=1234023 RepID=K2GZ46_9BACT|nr:MAG: hypothetical protein ACD_3C00020G0002 [uncultured bacterium (gcode 4)]
MQIPFKKPVYLAIIFFSTLWILSIWYGAYNALSPVNTWDPLTKTIWNQMADNIADLNTRVSTLVSSGSLWTSSGSDISYNAWNVWIGTSSPEKSLHIKTTAWNAELDIQTTTKDKWGIFQEWSTEDLKFWSNWSNTLILKKNGDAVINTVSVWLGSGSIYTNTRLGVSALASNTTGNQNTAVGYSTLTANTTGIYNSALGLAALGWNTTGSFNSAWWHTALQSNSSGNSNTGFGYQTLVGNTSGNYNVALGARALYHNNSDGNVAIGRDSLINNSSGDYNVANWFYSLYNNTLGNHNTSIGAYTLYNNSSGVGNTVLGYNTWRGIVTGSNNTIIWANVTGLDPDLSNTIIIADGAWVNRIHVNSSWNVWIGTASPSYKLHVSWTAAWTSWTNLSDQRYKKNIETIENPLDIISKLRWVTFDWRKDEFKNKNFTSWQKVWFIAQEVERVLPQAVTTDKEGYKWVEYANLTAVLVEAVKEQQKQIQELKKEIASLKQ